jgi:iron complex outermembrane receptor protein
MSFTRLSRASHWLGTTMLYATLSTAAGMTLLSSNAFAEENVALDTIVVDGGEAGGSLTVSSNAQASEEIQKIPGGVAVITSEEFEDRFAINYEDTLRFVPGVYAQKRFAEEERLSIRGSGLSRSFHMRGLTLLQDGIPFNTADGAADFQQQDPLALQRLEVYKGGNGLQYGSSTLGGAVNMVSKTGRSHPETLTQFEAGSDGFYRGHLSHGDFNDVYDYYIGITGKTSDGWVQHSNQKDLKINANLGKKLSDSVETRFYVQGNIIDLELPGSVSKRQALDNPTVIPPSPFSSVATDWKRDINSLRVANKTTFQFGDDDKFDVGAFLNWKNLFHPITPFVGVIDQKSIEYGVFADISGSWMLGDYRNEYKAGITSHFGETDAKRFQNIAGQRGALLSDTTQRSDNVTVYASNSFFVTPELALVTGGQLVWSKRSNVDKFTPANTDRETFTALNPQVGLLYEPWQDIQFFTNVTRSYEPPTFSELTQGGAAGFTPVDAQRAWTVEVGTRGEYDFIAWDLSLYRAWLDKEMLQFTPGGNIPAATFNADETVHQGVELGLDVRLFRDLLSEGDKLTWRNAYTFADFSFEGDVQFGNNDLAGQPNHFLQYRSCAMIMPEAGLSLQIWKRLMMPMLIMPIR